MPPVKEAVSSRNTVAKSCKNRIRSVMHVQAGGFDGHENGYENGHENGHENGYENGYENGHENGYENGYASSSACRLAPCVLQIETCAFNL
ncbi:MAG: hypothetical protein RBU30_09165 [Polyangia bacterium]|nr:hypothetical protein [Polyangia bacterium]